MEGKPTLSEALSWFTKSETRASRSRICNSQLFTDFRGYAYQKIQCSNLDCQFRQEFYKSSDVFPHSLELATCVSKAFAFMSLTQCLQSLSFCLSLMETSRYSSLYGVPKTHLEGFDQSGPITNIQIPWNVFPDLDFSSGFSKIIQF